jgi:hypothetical protein
MHTLRCGRGAWFGALLAAALLAAGCSKKLTTVDPGYTSPEGRRDPRAHLYVQRVPSLVSGKFEDKAPPGPSDQDTYEQDSVIAFDSPASAVLGTIIDHSQVSSWQVLRREPGGGFRAPLDFLIDASTRFLERQWDVTTFVDHAPSSYTPPTYLARGAQQGIITHNSPLTNEGVLSDSLPFPIDIASDSLRDISWSAVPDAEGYYVQVFQLSNAALNEVVADAMPVPLALQAVKNTVVAYVPANPELPTEVLWASYVYPPQIEHPAAVKSGFLVRVTAVSKAGNIVGATDGDLGFAFVSSHEYILFPLGALAHNAQDLAANGVAAGVGTKFQAATPPLVPAMHILPPAAAWPRAAFVPARPPSSTAMAWRVPVPAGRVRTGRVR